MSTPQAVPSLTEIDGRLQALATQRDNAQNICVLQSGQIARLSEELVTAKAELEALKADAEHFDEFHNRGTLGVAGGSN